MEISCLGTCFTTTTLSRPWNGQSVLSPPSCAGTLSRASRDSVFSPLSCGSHGIWGARQAKRSLVVVGSSEGTDGSGSSDWRAFRARLIATEQQQQHQQEQQQQQQQGTEEPSTLDPKQQQQQGEVPLPTHWAHPILKPEAGCVLIATDKLDELSIFERTVIILLSAGSNKANEGPFGLILNRPLPHSLKDIRPNDQSLLEAFGESQVHFGGPLVSDLILLLQAEQGRKGYQEVVPGVFYSSAEAVEQAVQMIKDKVLVPKDIRFFFGYAGWAKGQLEREVEDGYWFVAACSTNMFISGSTASLWEEILRLMGGQYAELSKKPKKRWFNK